MPSYTRNVKRDNLVFVPCNTKIHYGFKTKDLSALGGVSSADVTALGHLSASAATAVAGAILVIGASAPKPPRVKKAISNAAAGAQKSVSTFCSKTGLGVALSAGWSLVNQGVTVSLRAASAQSGSISAIATLSNGAKYVFPMNKADFDAYGAALGLESSTDITTTTERDSLVRGSSTPKPGKASKILDGGGTFSSFYTDGTNVATAGFNILNDELVIAAAPAP